jgi:hypothetical protein
MSNRTFSGILQVSDTTKEVTIVFFSIHRIKDLSGITFKQQTGGVSADGKVIDQRRGGGIGERPEVGNRKGEWAQK